MAATWSSGLTFQPPSYDEAIGEINEITIGGDLTFIDFLPDCLEPGGFLTKPTFETFRSLVDRANEWLRTHQCWEVKTCESVEFNLKNGEMNTQKMTYLEYGEARTCYVRGLRLWIVPGMNFGNTGQQIGYKNLIPQTTEESSFFRMPTYENLREVLDRFNNEIGSNPIPGKIINVETLEVKSSSSGFDPDRSNWMEVGNMRNHFLLTLRVFFEVTPPVSESTSELIGIVDFLPQKIVNGGLLTFPKYEPFSNVVANASAWCSQQNTIRICNAQSLEIKLKAGYEVDTQKMSLTEYSDRTTFYVRILRIAYAMKAVPRTKEQNEQQRHCVRQLTCKTFIPVQLTSGFFVPDFETLYETKQRMEAWIKVTGAQVISAETAVMRLFTGGEAKDGIEASFTYSRSERNVYWIHVLKLYLNGFYHEPPTELLPTVPEVQDQKCCTFI